MALALGALGGYGGFPAAAFAWPTWRARRAGEPSRWRRPVSAVDAVGEVACLAGCGASLLAPALARAGVVPAATRVWPAARAAAAGAGLALGAAVALAAQRHLAGQWRAGVEASTALVTDGPFARCRNPFYAGCILASAGVAAAVPSPLALAGLGLHLGAAEVIVRGVEEPCWPPPTAPPTRPTAAAPGGSSPAGADSCKC